MILDRKVGSLVKLEIEEPKEGNILKREYSEKAIEKETPYTQKKGEEVSPNLLQNLMPLEHISCRERRELITLLQILPGISTLKVNSMAGVILDRNFGSLVKLEMEALPGINRFEPKILLLQNRICWVRTENW